MEDLHGKIVPAGSPIPVGYYAQPVREHNGCVFDPGLYQLIRMEAENQGAGGEDLTIPQGLEHMSHKEQINLFQNRLRCLVNEFRSEYSLTYADAIGVLHIVTAEVTQELLDNQNQEND